MLLAQVGYDDRSSKLDPAQRAQAVDRAWFAFEHIPAKYRNHRWPWLLKLASQALTRPEDATRRADLLAMAAPYAEDPRAAFRDQVAQWVLGIAIGLSEQKTASPALRAKGTELLERWAAGKDEQLAILGRRGLAQRLGDPRGSLDAALAYEAAARKIVDLGSQKNRDQRDAQIILAARNYRLAGHADRARDLLESFDVVLPPNSANVAGTNTAGEHDYELGVAYQSLGQHDKAMQVYLRAIERNPTVVIFSGLGSDLLKRIENLGGIPLRKDRPVDVHYFPHNLATSRPAARPFGTVTMFLASDGQKIYLGGLNGLYAFDLASETWQKTTPPELAVTCLAYGAGQLWVGTDGDGLWRREVATGNWRQIAAGRLPDRHVEALTIHGSDVYAAVGTQASGGLIRIDNAERIHLFDQPSAPPQAPTHVVVTDKLVLARTEHRIHQWSFESQSWQVFDVGMYPPRLFLGATGVWCSTGTRELTRWGDTPGENARFKAAWYLPENNQGYVMSVTKLGYAVSFVSERGEQVWFGGTPYVPFVSSGLYRFDLKTGQFYKFGPADGFKALQNWHCVHAGQWIADRLWLATDAGLCRVTPATPATLPRPGRVPDAILEPRR